MGLEIVAVAVPAPLFRSFDYLVPDGLRERLQPGVRVKVPFGRRRVIGVVLEPPRHEVPAAFAYKPVEAVLDEAPLIPDELLALCQWAAAYYQHPLGEVIAAALPAPLRSARKLRTAKPAVDEPASETPPELTEEQAAALEQLRTLHGFGVALLDGVTGSGKTELYLRLAQDVLARGRQVLALVPEIGLTPQLVERFTRRFGAGVASYHSGMTEAERARVWLRARAGELSVVVGTRSAAFLPLARPGLILIDEEHDVSFKQQDGFRYHARDLAILRAQRLGIPVVLGSATPSLESLHNARNRRYRHLRLARRVRQHAPPPVQVLDLRGRPLRHGLSEPLLEAMERHLAARGQVLLFINRRGYAPALLCHDCGWAAHCFRCDAHLTLHRARRRLICHHCGAEAPVPAACGGCGATGLTPVGQGTERIEDALCTRFPQYRLERFDSDRMGKRGEWPRLLTDVREGRVQILVGTQMLAKGHDFAGLSLVGIVNVDQGLYGADFRALERMGQLVTQVAGRAGRAEAPGEVILQTHEPQHPALRRLVQGGYPALCETLLEERDAAALPPYAHLALLRADSTNETAPRQFLEQAAQRLESPKVRLFGPAPAPMERRAGRVRAQLLLQSGSRSALQKLLADTVPALDELPAARKVRWSVDVDPVDLF